MPSSVRGLCSQRSRISAPRGSLTALSRKPLSISASEGGVRSRRVAGGRPPREPECQARGGALPRMRLSGEQLPAVWATWVIARLLWAAETVAVEGCSEALRDSKGLDHVGYVLVERETVKRKTTALITGGLAVVAFCAALAAVLGSTAPDAKAASCARGTKAAVIAGNFRCLRVGQKCSARYQSGYRKYWLHCASGRLRRGTALSVKPAPAPATPHRWTRPFSQRWSSRCWPATSWPRARGVLARQQRKRPTGTTPVSVKPGARRTLLHECAMRFQSQRSSCS
jgi:hypothetical protein